MSGIGKHHNHDYSAGIPLALGDRYYGQDLGRDFHFLRNEAGQILKDLSVNFPVCMTGGIVTQGGGANINVTLGYGYVKKAVTIPDSFASLPPTTMSADLEAVRVAWGALTNFNGASAGCSAYTITDDGATPNYVKVAYAESDGNTRARAKKSGTYSYEKVPFYDFTVNATAPVAGIELCLAKFTSSGGVYTFLETPYRLHHYDLNLDFRRQKTLNTKFGFWGDVVWASTTTIIIKPKFINGFKWVGCILNNGKYLESATSITVTLDANTLDNIAQVQANSWYILYGYEISATGLLGFNLGFAPYGTCHTGSSTTSIIPHQLNSKDINKLFPVGAGLAIWHDGTHFETPIWKYGVGYTPDGALSFVGSYSGANIVPAGTLGITPVDTDPFYQVDGFQPLDVTGAIAAVIGAKGWLDTGIRIYSNASSQIQNFSIYNNLFKFSNGSGSGDYNSNAGLEIVTLTSSFVNYRLVYCPPDKSLYAGIYLSTTDHCWTKPYYATYGEGVMTGAGGYSEGLLFKHSHNILNALTNTSGVIIVRGYEI